MTQEGQSARKKENDIYNPNEDALRELDRLLLAYGRRYAKIDELDRETSAIVQTSPVGQAPPIFHRKVGQMVALIAKDIAPLWEELKHKSIPGSKWRSFWMEIPIANGSSPPAFSEIQDTLVRFA